MNWKRTLGNWKRILATATLAVVFVVPNAATPPALFQGPGAHGNVYNGTGRATGAPVALDSGANTITVTSAGTFTVYLPVGYSAVAATGTMTVTASPVALVAGRNTITTTGEVGNYTVTVTALWPDMVGVFECRGTLTRFALDGTRVSYKLALDVMVSTQADSVISNGDLYIGDDIAPTWADVVGFVGAGAYPRLTLYAGIGDPTGYPVVLNAIVKLNKDGTPRSIEGKIEGLLDAATDAQISGTFKGNWTALV